MSPPKPGTEDREYGCDQVKPRLYSLPPPSIHTYTQGRVASTTAQKTGGGFFSSLTSMGAFICWLKATSAQLFLPHGYPDSVAPGYLRYLLLVNCAVGHF